MHDSALMFVDGKGYWRADQESVLFYGSHGREDVAFLVTAEALARADGREESPTAQTALDLFRAHHGALRGIAHDMWAKNNKAQGDYLITQAVVAARLA